MKGDYSNRELDSYFKEMTDTLGRIEAQTIKTNGRVNKLENWRSYVTGALAVSGIIIILVAYVFRTTTDELKAQIKEVKQTQR